MRNIYEWLIFVLLLSVSFLEANAYSPPYVPLNLAVAQAEAIVEAHITRIPQRLSRASGDSAEVIIKRVLKGALKPGVFTVHLQPLHDVALGKLQLGKDYILFLRAVGADSQKFEVMLDGTRLRVEEDIQLITTAVELSPAWSEPQDGLSTLLTAEKFRIKVDEELDLWMGYRNTSIQNITLKYRDWPLDVHTYWKLTIDSKAGNVVEAVPHPTLTRQSINDYFSRSARSYEIILEPQKEYFFGLKRVNSANPGWGYKEEVDFKYYPMAKGKYTITATNLNFLNDVSITATGLTVWLE
jgi:hypothetical protein